VRSAVRAATGIAPFPIIPLFAEGPTHPFAPLGRRPTGARSEGQGRPSAGASRAPFTEASTLVRWRRRGGGLAIAIAAFLLSGVAAPFAASAQNAPFDRTTASHPYAAHVADAVQRFGIPESWIWAVMRVESNGDARAVSAVGAIGLMQIMPGTWATLRARYSLGSDPFDARDNIMAGAAYLREMFDRYGNATAMLAAYNAGPGRYDEHLARGRPLPGETLAYLAKLAPITSGAGDTQLAAAPAPDPFAWRRAALFAARSATPSTVQPDTANDAANARAERPLTDGEDVAVATITPLSAGLFVPVSRRSPQ
jgi:hypothetical protein